MSDRRITLFELHTHGDVQFGPSTVPGMGSSEADVEVEAEAEQADEGGGSTAGRAFLALVVLVVAAAAVRRFRGGDGERPDVPLEESDEIAPTQD